MITIKDKTFEQKKEQVRDFRPIDDTFFEVLADDKGVCQELLQTILEDETLTVEDVIVQSSKRNIYGRSVRLDALCTLGDGKKCNVEVQRSDGDDHLKRVRFNSSSITVHESQKRQQFKEIVDVIVVYISEFDIFKKKKVIYHVDSVIRETNERVDDGLERIFVNTAVKDGTTISEYMDCFLQKEVDNEKFPELTRRMKYLKIEEGGMQSMCEVMERYIKQAIKEVEEEAEKATKEAEKATKDAEKATKEAAEAKEAYQRANITAIKNMLEFNVLKEDILKKYSVSEYETAIAEIQCEKC